MRPKSHIRAGPRSVEWLQEFHPTGLLNMKPNHLNHSGQPEATEPPVAARSPGVPLSEAQIQLLRRSFAQIEPQAGIAALLFYRNLFTLRPGLRRLFHTSVELQGRKLMESLEYVIATLEAPDKLVPVLKAMGRRHVSYHVKEEHYPVVVEAMLQTLAECLGQDFPPDVHTAWESALNFVSDVMKQGATEAIP
jgi:hemoglobin-like flavoprotein